MTTKSAKSVAANVAANLTQRPRRNRRTASIRSMVRETHLEPGNFILPLFVREGKNESTPIASMPGQARLSMDLIVAKAKEAEKLGISGIALFPLIEEKRKDKFAKESLNKDGLLQRTIRELKDRCPHITVIADVAMDPYSSDGHDGFVQAGEIVNDVTLEILAQMAVSQAEAGADIVAPSDMMDGRVAAIRKALDHAGQNQTGILSYSVKYASAFYGPFREALDSAPRAGDKKTYQMDPANRREAIREVLLDVKEGADMVMVKPAGAYLDVIQTVKSKVNVPVAAYQVSGEYAMIHAASKNGWIDLDRARDESLLAIKRAGADIILTYFAIDMAKALHR